MQTLSRISFILFGCIALFLSVHIGQALALGDDAGFVKANIWYSSDKPEEGVKLKIYTFVFNPEEKELRGTVRFFSGSIFLGKVDFVAPPRGVKNLSIDWTPTAGSHEIFAKLENTRFISSLGKEEDVYLLGNETDKSKINVEKKIIPTAQTKTEVGVEAQAKNSLEDQNLPTMSASKVVNTIVDITPKFIADPVVSGANKLEEIRSMVNTVTINKKDNTQKEVEDLEKSEDTGLLKPWKQVQLFFLTIFAYIFASKFLFYAFWIILIIFIVRFIRRKFFL